MGLCSGDMQALTIYRSRNQSESFIGKENLE
jgi:hypothetical protein